jgi:hypothetical protein
MVAVLVGVGVEERHHSAAAYRRCVATAVVRFICSPGATNQGEKQGPAKHRRYRRRRRCRLALGAVMKRPTVFFSSLSASALAMLVAVSGYAAIVLGNLGA